VHDYPSNTSQHLETPWKTPGCPRKTPDDLLDNTFQHLSNTLQGYRITQRCGGSGDGGVDLRLVDSGGHTIGVQCKSRSNRRIGLTDVQKFRDQLSNVNVTRGFYISTQGFTREALEFASANTVTTYDWDHLRAMIVRHESFFERIDIQQILTHGTVPPSTSTPSHKRTTWTERETEVFVRVMQPYATHDPKPWTRILEEVHSRYPGVLHEKRDATSLKDKWRELTMRKYV
jgi:hypothetical protein